MRLENGNFLHAMIDTDNICMKLSRLNFTSSTDSQNEEKSSMVLKLIQKYFWLLGFVPWLVQKNLFSLP